MQKLQPENLKGRNGSWRTRYRWEDSIRFNLKERGCEGVDWIQLAQYSIHFNATLA
jgi:hypothetical protein